MKQILSAVLGLVLVAGCSSRHEKAKKDPVDHEPVITVQDKVNGQTLDPVCGQEVQAGYGPRESYKGHMYFFCSEECETAFTTDPSCYVEGVPSPEPKVE